MVSFRDKQESHCFLVNNTREDIRPWEGIITKSLREHGSLPSEFEGIFIVRRCPAQDGIRWILENA